MEISAETQKATVLAANAKINLSLAVTGKAPNGYHTIDTVILPITLSDTVCVALADTVTVCYTDGRVYPDDVAYKTAKAICKRFGLSGVSVRIDKRIPEGAGLGGSSADAAAYEQITPSRGFRHHIAIAQRQKTVKLRAALKIGHCTCAFTDDMD